MIFSIHRESLSHAVRTADIYHVTAALRVE